MQLRRPAVSNFFHCFEKLKLKRLITACYKSDSADPFSRNVPEKGKFLVYDGDKDGDRILGCFSRSVQEKVGSP